MHLPVLSFLYLCFLFFFWILDLIASQSLAGARSDTSKHRESPVSIWNGWHWKSRHSHHRYGGHDGSCRHANRQICPSSSSLLLCSLFLFSFCLSSFGRVHHRDIFKVDKNVDILSHKLLAISSLPLTLPLPSLNPSLTLTNLFLFSFFY